MVVVWCKCRVQVRFYTSACAHLFLNIPCAWVSLNTAMSAVEHLAHIEQRHHYERLAQQHYERYLKLDEHQQANERRAIQFRLDRCEREAKFGEYFQVQWRYQRRVEGLEQERRRLGVLTTK